MRFTYRLTLEQVGRQLMRQASIGFRSRVQQRATDCCSILWSPDLLLVFRSIAPIEARIFEQGPLPLLDCSFEPVRAANRMRI